MTHPLCIRLSFIGELYLSISFAACFTASILSLVQGKYSSSFDAKSVFARLPAFPTLVYAPCSTFHLLSTSHFFIDFNSFICLEYSSSAHFNPSKLDFALVSTASLNCPMTLSDLLVEPAS